MEYTQLGHSDLSVSRICMGVWGSATQQTDSILGLSENRRRGKSSDMLSKNACNLFNK